MQEADLQAIQQRNARVEADKAWETSKMRRITIVVMTYLVAVVYMRIAGLSNPYLGAFVPSGGYLLSTISIPYFKGFWLTKIYKKQD